MIEFDKLDRWVLDFQVYNGFTPLQELKHGFQFMKLSLLFKYVYLSKVNKDVNILSKG